MNKQESIYHVCVISYPLSKAFRMPLSNLIDVVSAKSQKLFVIIGSYDDLGILGKQTSNVRIKQFDIGIASHPLTRIINFIRFQLLSIVTFVKIVRDVNLVIFFMEWDPFIQMIIARLLRKKTIWMLPSSPILMRKYNPDPLLLFSEYLERICFNLSDKIVLFSDNLIYEWDLAEWAEKIFIAPNHFIDFNQFKIKKSYKDRDNLVGYIGRFSKEKGITNFLKAAEIILKNHPDIRIFLGGSGYLGDSDVDLHKMQNQGRLIVGGWISHDTIQESLNDLKILVIPSFTEALPNMMLEAMASGTLVIASNVGAIPDIIKNGVTGFLLENNSPECIADTVNRALNSPNIESIVEQAEKYVRTNFSFQSATQKYQQVLKELD